MSLKSPFSLPLVLFLSILLADSCGGEKKREVGPASSSQPPPEFQRAVARTPRAKHLAAPPVKTPAERALILFRKHGMEFGPVDWPLFQVPPTERVPKEIRMRVHRNCHKCSLSFGPDRICPGCSHKRCKKCPKYPYVSPFPFPQFKERGGKICGSPNRTANVVRLNRVKKPKDKSKGKERAGEKAAETTARKKKLHYDPNITIPDRHGGQPRVRKLARQRVHRLCHRCKTDFAGEKLCRNCGHTRCRTCPHDPLVFPHPITRSGERHVKRDVIFDTKHILRKI